MRAALEGAATLFLMPATEAPNRVEQLRSPGPGPGEIVTS
jgi:hypothetical protein